MTALSSAELLARVKERYSGAVLHFIIARLELRAGLGLHALTPDDRDPEKAERLRRAILEVCPDVFT